MSKKTQCFYEVLELSKECTPEEIKTAYKKFALKYHPDKNRDKPEEAKQKFQEISEAYTVLSDPEKRSTYDKYGTIDEDEIGFDYDMFMNQFGGNDFGSFMTMMMGGDGFFSMFDMSSSRSRNKKYGRKQRQQQSFDPFSQMFQMSFSSKPAKKSKKNKEDEEWETDSEDEKKHKKDAEWETDSDEEEWDDDDEEEEAQKQKIEEKPKPQQKQASKKGGFNPFGGAMDPFQMMMEMGMGFEFMGGDDEDDLDFIIIQEFAAKHVQILKNGNVKCRLCSKTFHEDKLPDHFEDDHEEEFDDFKEEFIEKQMKQNNSKKGKKKK